ncbi:MAG: GAF domain-containing protein, partial [Candidatus Eremiobacterota bacterium]
MLTSMAVLHLLSSNPVYWFQEAPMALPFRALGALLIYLPLALLTPLLLQEGVAEDDRPGWEYARTRSLGFRLAAFLGGVALALLMRQNAWNGLWFLPLLGVLARLARLEAQQAEHVSRERMRSRLDRVSGELQATRDSLVGVREELHHKIDAYVLLDDLSQSVANSASTARTLDLILNSAWRLVQCQTVVLFLEEDGALVPAAFHSPLEERLHSWRLLNLNEPGVERAWRTGQVQLWSMPMKVFEGELAAVALPVRGLGVLYVGKSSADPFTERQLHLLSILSNQAAVALQASRRLEALEKAWQAESRTRGKLQDWLKSLDGLLEASRSISLCLRVEPLLDELEAWLMRLVPHDYRLISLSEFESTRREHGPPLHPEAEREVLGLLQGRPLPLLLEDLSVSRYAGCFPGAVSLLAVPLVGEGGPMGAVLLAGPTPFTREQQHLLAILAYQAGVALQNAHLHSLWVDAYRKLQAS